MRIAVNAASAAPQHRGTGAYVINVIQALCDLGKDEVVAVIPHWASENVRHLGDRPGLSFKVAEPVPGEPELTGEFERRQYWEQQSLPAELKEITFDVMFGPAFALPLDWHGPATATVHDLAFERRGKWNTFANDDYHMRWARMSAEHADNLLSVSEFTATEIRQRWGFDKDIFVSLLAPSLRWPEGRTESSESFVRDRFDIDGPYILYIGDSVERKNLARLLTVYRRLLDDNLDGGLRLVLVAPPNERLRQLATELRITDRITFVDYCEEEEKPHLYSAATISTYPAIFEGFGLPPLEAMSCGTAVATSNAAAIREVAGDAAAIFDPLDVDDMTRVIGELINDEHYRKELEVAGQARAATFTWQRTARVTRDALHAATLRSQ
jgi:glycosyltransferase involved in cell wall biosynthesis